VHLAVLSPNGLAELKASFAISVASLQDPRGIAQLVDGDDLKLLHRLRTGQALQGEGQLDQLRVEFSTGHLAAYLFSMAVIAAVNRLTDVAGDLADGHDESAAWMHREVPVYTVCHPNRRPI
jgi:hypothetical protein